jgi:hypothetical protein
MNHVSFIPSGEQIYDKGEEKSGIEDFWDDMFYVLNDY